MFYLHFFCSVVEQWNSLAQPRTYQQTSSRPVLQGQAHNLNPNLKVPSALIFLNDEKPPLEISLSIPRSQTSQLLPAAYLLFHSKNTNQNVIISSLDTERKTYLQESTVVSFPHNSMLTSIMIKQSLIFIF